ncbi:hypothetical protein ScPMuIL_006354 [Solemya velum]
MWCYPACPISVPSSVELAYRKWILQHAIMAEVCTDFGEARDQFRSCVDSALSDGVLKDVVSLFDTCQCFEKKSAFDQAFRDVIKDKVLEEAGCDMYKKLVSFAVEASQQDVCSPSLPFLMLCDVFDMVTLDQCEVVFELVEDKVNTWKAETFYEAGKNYLLRMCNDLLRRLSKSQNTVFCGRIQLFLSRLFPLSEKSALNLMSQFNLDNVTVFTTRTDEPRVRQIKKEEPGDIMEVEEGEMNEFSGSVPVDYNLYRKFWSLQDFFRRPSQCYDKVAWRTFMSNSNEVLTAFSSNKLDDVKSSKKRQDLQRHLADTKIFFAKYLTSEKLFDLQLSDSNFRRYVLLQFLILFQYLNTTVKFKSANYVLTDDQSQWIKDHQEKVMQLIRETPPDGEEFAQTVDHILTREEFWNNWKNEGCPSYEKERSKELSSMKVKPKRRRVGDDLRASGGKLIKMGSAELTRLWNLDPDNLDACKSEKRIFLPTLRDYFAEAVEQADPEAMVEEEYKVINDQVFQWKSLRLLARSSPHFFTHTNIPAQPLPQYLDQMLPKLPKPTVNEEMKTEVGDEEGIKGTQEEEEELKQAEDSQVKDATENAVTTQQLEALAIKLQADWRKLATELNFPEEDITYFESETDDESKRALKMLTIWQENDPERSTVGSIKILH